MRGVHRVEHYLFGDQGWSESGERVSSFRVWHVAHGRRCGDSPGDRSCAGASDEANQNRRPVIDRYGKPFLVWRQWLSALGRTIRLFRVLLPDGVISSNLGDDRRDDPL